MNGPQIVCCVVAWLLVGCDATVELGTAGAAPGGGGAGGEPATSGGGAELGGGGEGGGGGAEEIRCLPDVIPCPEGLVCAAFCEVHDLDPCSDRDAKKWICVEPGGSR